jgi:hypothetical protein
VAQVAHILPQLAAADAAADSRAESLAWRHRLAQGSGVPVRAQNHKGVCMCRGLRPGRVQQQRLLGLFVFEVHTRCAGGVYASMLSCKGVGVGAAHDVEVQCLNHLCT